MRQLHTIHLLIRDTRDGAVKFLLYPHEKWTGPDGSPYLALPAKKTVTDVPAEFVPGTPLDEYVDRLMQDKGELGVPAGAYALEQELRAAHVRLTSPTELVETHYTVFPLDLWVRPDQREPLRERLGGQWLSCDEAAAHPRTSPTARHILKVLPRREKVLDGHYAQHPEDESKPVPVLVAEDTLERLLALIAMLEENPDLGGPEPAAQS
jgi:hypothetical protein